MIRYWIRLAFLTIGLSGCFSNIYLIPPAAPLREKEVGGEGPAKIALVDISGTISDSQDKDLFGDKPGMLATLKEKFDRIAADSAVKAVVLRINSPGGTVTASDIIYHEIERLKARTGKKVVAAIMDVGASGGYYIAAAADRIVAHPTAVTGSIGVIMLTVNLQGLLEKIGVTGTAIKSGPLKDMGSPLRPMTEDERKLFQGVIDQLYDRFVSVVVAGRKNLTADQVRTAADGRIYTGPQALERGLIDRVGYLEDAIQLARELSGLKQARVVTYQRPGGYRNNIYSAAPDGGGMTVNLVNLDLSALARAGTPQFMYLWAP